MKKIVSIAVFAVGFGALAGCTNDPQINAVTGGLIGAAAGSKIGSGSGRTAAMLGGAALGTAAGGNARTN
ncbi:MAG: Glycine zipper 2TM domain [Roseibaca calidilacus]|uniref:17 kDa surface antigen n=1 Tax=Roseibaca calidilacus TaxID=1666912 RepID=A0A0P7WV83_9RHOB|nr:glycine zipper 2TM domain-containing protein [Roseibaca calidilacus]KPP95091.1 MAG: Glycine zipper 2TM domain [Roseibaca calidilacus]CUX79339.1 Glycine zipper 2TM domain-containing protein [Roseibaca calidilacus]